MAINYPPIFTQILDEEVTYNRPVTEETLKKMAQNMNMLSKLAPVGTIRAVNLNQIGVSVPSADIWQLCDGSEITNPTSPLRTVGLLNRFTPNLLGRFIMGASGTGSNTTGGDTSIALIHSHSGFTGGNGPNSTIGEEGEEKHSRHDHVHFINPALPTIDIKPIHFVVALYIKIN